MSTYDLIGYGCIIPAALCALYMLYQWIWNCGHTEGYRDGWNEGFADCRKFQELLEQCAEKVPKEAWFKIAESDVLEERKQIWKSEYKTGKQWP